MKFDAEFIEECKSLALKSFEMPAFKKSHDSVIDGCHQYIHSSKLYRATKIAETLYASLGPKKDKLNDFKSFLWAFEITHIVSLGLDDDFTNYGYKTRDNSFIPFPPGSICKLTNRILPAPIQGTRFCIVDGGTLDGRCDKVLTQILATYMKSLTHITNVHCRAGTGRTGYMIMTYFYFELLFYGEQCGLLKVTPTAETIVKHCKDILDKVREKIPNFVHNAKQFSSAIQNAIHIYTKVNDPANEHLKKRLLQSKPHLSDIANYAHLYPNPVEEKTESKTAADCIKQGDAYFGKQQWNSAIQEYSRAIRLEPTSIAALENRAHAHFACDELPAAARDYTQIVHLTDYATDTQAHALENRAIIYHLAGQIAFAVNDYAEVCEMYIKMHPQSTDESKKAQYVIKIAGMNEKLANIFLLGRSIGYAEKYYKKALEWDPLMQFTPDCSEWTNDKVLAIRSQYPFVYEVIKDSLLTQRLHICYQEHIPEKICEIIQLLDSIDIHHDDHRDLKKKCIELVEVQEKITASLKESPDMTKNDNVTQTSAVFFKPPTVAESKEDAVAVPNSALPSVEVVEGHIIQP